MTSSLARPLRGSRPRRDPVSRRPDAWRVLADTRTRVDPVLRGAVDELPATMRRVAGYHFGWLDRDGRPLQAPEGAGKALRPGLVLLAVAAAAPGARTGPVDAAVLEVAAAVELVHNFSLVHDDVMDRDEFRRHRETVWKVFGAPMAILAGDALLSLATRTLVRGRFADVAAAVALLDDMVGELCEGQSEDLALESSAQPTLDECVAMAGRKTGALTAGACGLGVLVAGGTPEHGRALRSYGRHLGLVFQLADDVLGIWGTSDATGKPTGNDILNRKKSLPVVAALTAGNDAADELAGLYARPEPFSATDVDVAVELVERAGGRRWAERESSRRVALALAALDGRGLAPEPRAVLAELARLAAVRDH